MSQQPADVRPDDAVDGMATARDGAAPGDRPPAGRRLEHPPSDRYIQPNTASTAHPERAPGSIARGVIGGLTAAAVGSIVFTVLAGGLALDVGLLVLAIFLGWLVARGVRWGVGPAGGRTMRLAAAVGLALLALTLGETGTWLWARAQGGVLSPLDHLWTTYGPILPLEYLLAVASATWSAR